MRLYSTTATHRLCFKAGICSFVEENGKMPPTNGRPEENRNDETKKV